MARKYLIETSGCQMNVHDSERMAGLLEQAGFEEAADAADADVVVINTCSVRERAGTAGESKPKGESERAKGEGARRRHPH